MKIFYKCLLLSDTRSFWRDLQKGKNKCESEQQKNRCTGRITSTINTDRADT